MQQDKKESGRAGGALLLWALGAPIPIVILVWLFARGC